MRGAANSVPAQSSRTRTRLPATAVGNGVYSHEMRPAPPLKQFTAPRGGGNLLHTAPGIGQVTAIVTVKTCTTLLRNTFSSRHDSRSAAAVVGSGYCIPMVRRSSSALPSFEWAADLQTDPRRGRPSPRGTGRIVRSHRHQLLHCSAVHVAYAMNFRYGPGRQPGLGEGEKRSCAPHPQAGTAASD